MDPGAKRLDPGVTGVIGPLGLVTSVTPMVRSGSDPGFDTNGILTGGVRMKRTVIATGAAALVFGAALFAQGGRPASPAGTAATEIGGKYDTSGAEPVYKGGKWTEITHGRPIKGGRGVFGGTGASYGLVD